MRSRCCRAVGVRAQAREHELQHQHRRRRRHLHQHRAPRWAIRPAAPGAAAPVLSMDIKAAPNRGGHHRGASCGSPATMAITQVTPVRKSKTPLALPGSRRRRGRMRRARRPGTCSPAGVATADLLAVGPPLAESMSAVLGAEP